MKLAVSSARIVSFVLLCLVHPVHGEDEHGGSGTTGRSDRRDLSNLRQEIPDDPPGIPSKGPRSAATPWVQNGFVSVQVNVDAQGNNIVGDAANEPSIAIDPTDPDKIVIGWRQFDTIASNFRQAGRAYSHNRGLNWTSPGVLQPGAFRSDPVLDGDGACDSDDACINDPH